MHRERQNFLNIVGSLGRNFGCLNMSQDSSTPRVFKLPVLMVEATHTLHPTQNRRNLLRLERVVCT